MSKTIVPALSCGFVSAAENDSLGTLASSPGGPGKQEKNREKPYLLCLFIFRKIILLVEAQALAVLIVRTLTLFTSEA